MDKQFPAPIGFNVTFTGMISLAIAMGLEFPMKEMKLMVVFTSGRWN